MMVAMVVAANMYQALTMEQVLCWANISFKPSNRPLRCKYSLLFFLFYRWENQGLKRLSNFVQDHIASKWLILELLLLLPEALFFFPAVISPLYLQVLRLVDFSRVWLKA